MTDKLRRDLLCLGAIAVALLVIYLPGLHNPLVFDDVYLTERLRSEYGTLRLQVRALSYGSFVWIADLFGEGWAKQRAFNLLLHFGVVVALAGLYREILRAVAPPAPAGAPSTAPVDLGQSPAFWVAIGFFALNPVAVYGTAYLIQRTILMATLFVATGLWFFARGLRLRQPPLFAAALACYGLAMLSKEHSVFAPIAAVPLYILVARPGAKRLAGLAAIGAVLVGVAAYALLTAFGNILGKPFDETSQVYLEQLAQIHPDAKLHAYPLSVMNQAYLFFHYGLRWLFPVSEWLSIQLRPPFPVTFLTFPHVLGLAGYAALVAGGFYAVARFRDWRALAGLSVLMPALLFATEFGLVWVQDPFVLYRSYLWAIGVPGLVFIFLHGWSPRITVGVAVVLVAILGFLAFERVLSLSSPERAYTDAIAKLPDDPRSVGRWYPYLNRGNVYFDQNRFDLAIRDFEASSALGDKGLGAFNIGSIRLMEGKSAESIRAFDRAEKEGYRNANLHFQRSQALLALGKPAEAAAELEKALTLDPSARDRAGILVLLGRSRMQLGRFAEAISPLEELLRSDPGNAEGRYMLGMAQIAVGQNDNALGTLEPLFKQDPQPGAFYARALAKFGLKRKAEALADIETAIQRGLDNPNVRQWRDKIRAMP